MPGTINKTALTNRFTLPIALLLIGLLSAQHAFATQDMAFYWAYPSIQCGTLNLNQSTVCTTNMLDMQSDGYTATFEGISISGADASSFYINSSNLPAVGSQLVGSTPYVQMAFTPKQAGSLSAQVLLQVYYPPTSTTNSYSFEIYGTGQAVSTQPSASSNVPDPTSIYLLLFAIVMSTGLGYLRKAA